MVGKAGIAALLAAIVAGIAAPPALAATTYDPSTTAAVNPLTNQPVPGYPSYIAVPVPVTALVNINCSFDPANMPNANYNVGDVRGAFTQTVNFNLRCSTPLNVAVVSSNGGLAASSVSGAVPAGYAANRDYQVTLNLQGSTASASATCNASTLVSNGTCNFRGPASVGSTTAAGVGLHLSSPAGDYNSYATGSSLTISDPAYTGANFLVANKQYQDTLTITIHAAQ